MHIQAFGLGFSIESNVPGGHFVADFPQSLLHGLRNVGIVFNDQYSHGITVPAKSLDNAMLPQAIVTWSSR
jgi:hypothetical protein